MAFSANIVTIAEMQFMAGENRDVTGDVNANHIFLQDMAEGYLSAILKHNLAGTGFTELNSTLRYLITEWAARMAGNEIVKFNMAGYTTRQEAEDIISINLMRMGEIIEELKKEDVQNFIGV